MPSQSATLRPGVSQGAYPQRNEVERSLADRIVGRVEARLSAFGTNRRLGVESIAAHVEHAAASMPAPETDDFADYLCRLKHSLLSTGLKVELVAQAFAVIRALADKQLGMRHYDVQLFAAWGLIRGDMVEMRTGEGKSLTATLAAGCAAMAGIPVHVITSNEYLAERDAHDMHGLYQALGLHCSVVKESMSVKVRREAYSNDVVYCTNKQVAFDYLRDRLAIQNENSQLAMKLRSFDQDTGPVLRGLCFAIVDEADSILIDEACTPLLLSRETVDPEREALYKASLALAARLEESRHFQLRPAQMQLTLTEAGVERIAELSQEYFSMHNSDNGLWRGKRRREWLVQQALQALHLYKADEHYLVREGSVVIIDPNTGRSMPDRSWQQGLHQMVESKEHCSLTGQRETLARLSLQRFYRRYLHLSGMSGTLNEVAGELNSVYAKQLVVVPSHKASQSRNGGSHLFKTSERKWHAIVQRVRDVHARGQPLLLGTGSVASSEQLSQLLHQHNIAHCVLNARQDASEARVIARAGEKYAVTVATNMAGRGTDIKLGRGVVEMGGLHVIACEPNQSSRVDRQLFGRCGRQGQPGCFELFVSLEDQLVSNYLPSIALKMASAGSSASNGAHPIMSRLVTQLPQRLLQSQRRGMRRMVLQQDRQMDELLAFSGDHE